MISVNLRKHIETLLPLIHQLLFQFKLVNNKRNIHLLTHIDILELLSVPNKRISPHLGVLIDGYLQVSIDLPHVLLY